MPQKKILVISHDASQTGAPILLLNLIKIMKEEGYRFHCVIKNGFGSLINAFSDVAESCIIYNKPFKKNIINTYRSKFEKKRARAKIKKLLAEVDFVISNTITNGDILPFIKENCKVPVISYVHELKMATDYFTRDVYVQRVISLSDHFFVPSKSVKCFLQKEYLIEGKKISVINSFVPEIKPKENNQQIKPGKENDLSASFIVGGMGTTDWRKGPDIFIQVAAQVFKLQPDADIQFVWKGGIDNGIEYKRLMYDIEKAGLNGKTILLQHSEDINSFYNCIDLFLLTSREDPYPLVVLEAAINKIPVICFSDAGGAAEFIETDSGTIVNYLDVVAAAKQVLKYFNNDHLTLMHGTHGFEKVRKLHQDKKLILKQIEQVIQ